MRELSVNEVNEVSGGHPFLWMVGGYVFGKVVDSLYEVDWGDSSEDPDTNLAP